MENFSKELFYAKLDLSYLEEKLNNSTSYEETKILIKQIKLLNINIQRMYEEYLNFDSEVPKVQPSTLIFIKKR